MAGKLALYSVARVQPTGGNSEQFRVSKLSTDFDVLESYNLRKEPQQRFFRCDCPSRYEPCKHSKLISHILMKNTQFQFGYFGMEPHAKRIIQLERKQDEV